MIGRFPWRAGLLAFAVLFGGAGGVLAHALPGSVLLLRQQGAELHLTIQFPLEDLIIAAPDLATLKEAKPEEPLSPELTDRLARYLGHHLLLTEDGVPLSLRLSDARLQPAYDDHVGHFMLVVSQWDGANVKTDPTSIALRYDAVMHEVRNSRAIVKWLAQDAESRVIAEFGLSRAADGILLDLH